MMKRSALISNGVETYDATAVAGNTVADSTATATPATPGGQG